MKTKYLYNLFIRHNDHDPLRDSIWLLHGFGESGLCFEEVFTSSINDLLNIYVVDFPGFGKSPFNPNCTTIRQHADLLVSIIREEASSQSRVNLVAHSLGAIIGNIICQQLGDQVNSFVSIEGNLTESDSFFSSQPANYATADAFYAYFEPQIAAKAVDDESFRRYHQSLKMAKPEALRQWSLSSTTYVEGDRCGHEFSQLSCERRYLWGDVATPQTTRDFLSAHQIPNSCYPDTGHWLMIEQPEPVYDEIRKVIQRN